VKYHKKNAKRVRTLEAKKAGYHLRRVCPANTFFTYIYTFPHSSSLSEADNATARPNKWRIERVCFCNHRLALQTDRHSDLQAAQRRADGRTDHRRSRSALLAYSSARVARSKTGGGGELQRDSY